MRSGAAAVVIVSVVVAACSAVESGDVGPTSSTTSTTQAASQLDTSGPQTVDVAGITFSYECRGEGSPIAFVEDGLGMPEEMGFDPAWHGWNTALDGMAELTTVCIYGRRGVGGTDPLAEGSVRTTSDQVDDLQSLWSALRVATPVVLVGHSVAGYNLRVATDRSADDVAGLVFVDATTPGVAEFDPNVPPPFVPEWLDLPASGQQTAATADVGDLPVYVISNGKSAPDWWDALQVELATISTNSQHVTLPESGHEVYIDDPQAIVDGLAWILQQIG